MAKTVVITGGSAGVGFATAESFARHGYRVGLIARGEDRLEEAATALRRYGGQVCAVPADMADAAAVERAADRIALELGQIDIWINNAMATLFAPVTEISAEEFRRGTEVTYLGTVHGTMAALRHMRHRQRGKIVNVGSALAYRAVPLQSVYCGAKHAIVGFTDSLRSELIHDRSGIRVSMVHLPAMNTPQFDWARNRMGYKARPFAPIFQPEMAARAIFFAATHHRRDVWVAMPTVKTILANRVAPGLLDMYLAWAGYRGQMSSEPADPAQPGNLFKPVPHKATAHGRFDKQARSTSLEMVSSRHRAGITLGAVALTALLANTWLKHRFGRLPSTS